MSAPPKKVCIADWDGTLSSGYTALHWLKFLVDNHLIEKQFLDEFHRCLFLYEKREINYRELVIVSANTVASSLKGIGSEVVENISIDFTVKALAYIFPFVTDLIRILKEHDIGFIIISGAPKEALGPICKQLGIDELYAVDFTLDQNNCYNGFVLNNYGLLEKKQEAINIILSHKVDVLFGMGNSGYDLPILEAAKNKIFVNDETLLRPIKDIQLVSITNAFNHIKSIIEEK
ncbi:MAG: HAD-IB family phosphatase [Pseudomonadota bacterium]